MINDPKPPKKHLFEIADDNPDGVLGVGILSIVVLLLVLLIVAVGTQHLRDDAEFKYRESMYSKGLRPATDHEWVPTRNN